MMPTHTPYYDFIQPMPRLNNEFADDQFLQDYLNAYLPEEVMKEITPDLMQLGKRTATEFIEWAADAERNEPYLIQFDAWGNRIDKIVVSQGWLNLEKVAAEEGLVAIGYERKYGEYSRLYQFAKLYLYTPSSAIYTCPLAMTDGAARLIEVHGDDFLKQHVFPHLISRNPATFKTSGQWMTERTGGSDVSRSMTLAIPNGDHYLLMGHKWFTSAITAHMAFTLASTELPHEGGRIPLSLFYLPIRDEDGKLNGIEIEALKDKLGTRALPTAQLRLTGARARLVGQKGKGVKTIATLFNITRIYNTISAVSYMRRAFALSKAYSRLRETFGRKLEQHPLHKKSLRDMEIAYQSNTLLALYLSRLLGKEECNIASDNEKSLLRFLTPVAKLYTAKQSIQYASEHIEMFGGIGYLEDSGIPAMLRDVQTLSIWEGTTNVLSLDMLRAAEKENGMQAFRHFADTFLQQVNRPALDKQKQLLRQKTEALFSFIQQIKNPGALIAASRDIAYYIAETTIALLWLDLLNKSDTACNAQYVNALNYWIHLKMNESSLRAAATLEIT
jgi:alkylation response protein AidB-like acyl-CoA dehydrogenase